MDWISRISLSDWDRDQPWKAEYRPGSASPRDPLPRSETRHRLAPVLNAIRSEMEIGIATFQIAQELTLLLYRTFRAFRVEPRSSRPICSTRTRNFRSSNDPCSTRFLEQRFPVRLEISTQKFPFDSTRAFEHALSKGHLWT